jgi:hypothetical protein
VMPHDYKRVLAERAARVEHDEHSVSTSGDGFVTAETETELA